MTSWNAVVAFEKLTFLLSTNCHKYLFTVAQASVGCSIDSGMGKYLSFLMPSQLDTGYSDTSSCRMYKDRLNMKH